MPFCELPLFPTPSSPRDGVLPVISIDRCRRLLDNPARALTLVPCGNISNVDQRLIDTVSNNAKRRLKIELSMPCGECAYACTSRRLSFDPGHFLGWRLPNRAPCNLHKPPESNRKRLHYSNEAGFPNVRNWARADVGMPRREHKYGRPPPGKYCRSGGGLLCPPASAVIANMFVTSVPSV